MDRACAAHVEEMVKVYRQCLTSDSWKRRSDLKRQLAKMEKELRQYQKYKGEIDGVHKKKTCGYQAV